MDTQPHETVPSGADVPYGAANGVYIRESLAHQIVKAANDTQGVEAAKDKDTQTIENAKTAEAEDTRDQAHQALEFGYDKELTILDPNKAKEGDIITISTKEEDVYEFRVVDSEAESTKGGIHVIGIGGSVDGKSGFIGQMITAGSKLSNHGIGDIGTVKAIVVSPNPESLN